MAQPDHPPLGRIPRLGHVAYSMPVAEQSVRQPKQPLPGRFAVADPVEHRLKVEAEMRPADPASPRHDPVVRRRTGRYRRPDCLRFPEAPWRPAPPRSSAMVKTVISGPTAACSSLKVGRSSRSARAGDGDIRGGRRAGIGHASPGHIRARTGSWMVSVRPGPGSRSASRACRSWASRRSGARSPGARSRAVERRGEVEDPAPGVEEIVVENLGHLAGRKHRGTISGGARWYQFLADYSIRHGNASPDADDPPSIRSRMETPDRPRARSGSSKSLETC